MVKEEKKKNPTSLQFFNIFVVNEKYLKHVDQFFRTLRYDNKLSAVRYKDKLHVYEKLKAFLLLNMRALTVLTITDTICDGRPYHLHYNFYAKIF